MHGARSRSTEYRIIKQRRFDSDTLEEVPPSDDWEEANKMLMALPRHIRDDLSIGEKPNKLLTVRDAEHILKRYTPQPQKSAATEKQNKKTR